MANTSHELLTQRRGRFCRSFSYGRPVCPFPSRLTPGTCTRYRAKEFPGVDLPPFLSILSAGQSACRLVGLLASLSAGRPCGGLPFGNGERFPAFLMRSAP